MFETPQLYQEAKRLDVDLPFLSSAAEDCGWTVCELIAHYLGDAAGQMDKLDGFLAENNVEEIQRLAHGCAGGSAMCGLVGLTQAFRELELATESGSQQDMVQKLIRLRELLNRLRGFSDRMAELESEGG